MWYRFQFKRLNLKFSIYLSLPVWTGSDGRHPQTQVHTPIERSTIPENFVTLSFTVYEKTSGQNDFLKTENRPYLPTGSEFLTNWKNFPRYWRNASFLKISRKSVQPSLRNRPDKKVEKNNNNNNNNNNKPYNQ